MKTRFSTLCLLLTSLAAATAGCDIDIDPPDDGGGSGADTDGDDESSGGKSVLSAGSSDGSGGSGDSSGPSDPSGSSTSAGSGLTTAGPDDGQTTGEDPDWPGDTDDGGTGGFPPSDACGAYCETELACDDFYPSEQDCMAECDGMRAEAAACAPALDELNACLGSLNCEEFSVYWAAIEAIANEQDPGEFPCLPQLAEFANCLDAGA